MHDLATIAANLPLRLAIFALCIVATAHLLRFLVTQTLRDIYEFSDRRNRRRKFRRWGVGDGFWDRH